MNRKFLGSLVAATLISAALPLAASAITIGVSDEVDTTIMSGHLTSQTNTCNQSSGIEWSQQSTSKVGSENDNSTTSSSVTDPAASAGSSTGVFQVSVGGKSGTYGTYNNESDSETSITGGQQAQTSIVNTVSAFANP